MANAVGLIRESIWRDRDFRALPRTAQAAYIQVLSQKDLDCAGVLTLHIDFLTKGCDEMSAENLWHDLKILEQARFIVVDENTDELLIRSYVRLISAPCRNAWKGAQKAAKMIVSPKIRSALAIELRRIGRADATDLATIIDAGYTPSEPPSNPLPTPSEPPTPFEPPSNPLSPDQSSSSVTYVDGWVGGSRARAHAREEPPPPPCPRHGENYEHDENCRHCKKLREYDEAETKRRESARRESARIRRQIGDNCLYCDDNHLREIPGGVIRCTHNPETFEQVSIHDPNPAASDDL